ncbi:hypothetical protein ACQPXH_20410 [Nocardia sp. CA-135953]|uniref:hypothetical protein n=1 Tax=Nocardia sp. CA-135953 TaxID=3239978 RepID=UPI003D9696AE
MWRDNTYPGVAVDIPSFTYSFHFEPNLHWSRTYAPGAELFQRTPIWMLPRLDAELGAAVQGVFDHVPFAQKATRLATRVLTETVVTFGAVYNQQLPFLVKGIEQICSVFLHKQVPDPVLREKLTPRYGFGCKRPSFSNTYYPTFLRDNVELVTDGITRVTRTGIRTVDGELRKFDMLVLATGFKMGDIPYRLHGSSGETLNELWDRDRRQSFEGIIVHGYPNLFLNPGPSLFATFDLRATHAVRVIKAARKRGATRVEVSATAQDRFMHDMRRRVRHTMFFRPGCADANTYYIDNHGDAPYLRPTSGPHGWWRQHQFSLENYEYTATSASSRDCDPTPSGPVAQPV